MDFPLSGGQVQDLVGHEIKLVPFYDIPLYQNDIESLFINECCLINYLSSPQMGHWCCLLKKDNTIYYFNPVGRFIDEAIEKLPKKYAKESNQDYPYLAQLFLNNPQYNYRYMDKRLQRKDTLTCGRWCGLFLRLKVDEEKFYRMFKDLSKEGLINLTNLMLEGQIR